MMKKILSAIVLCIGIGATAFAQQPNVGCMDRGIRIQAEQAKLNFVKQGMKVYKEAMIGMEPNTPFPVAVQLTKGTLYQIVYIGSLGAQKIKLELLDGQDKRIDVKTLDRPVENNSIIYSFIPDKTDMYLLMLTQKIKKSTCGSIAIFQKDDTKAAQPAGK